MATSLRLNSTSNTCVIISGKLKSRIFFQSEPEVISTVRALRRVTVLLMPAPSYTLTE